MSEWQEGYDAYREGLGPDANPYEDADHRLYWNLGWVAAEYADAVESDNHIGLTPEVCMAK